MTTSVETQGVRPGTAGGSAPKHRGTRRAARSGLLAGALWVALLAAPLPVAAQQVWVRGEVRLNLRTGPGTQFRIVSVVQTGDSARILTRGDGWTKVRMNDGKEGWIPEGYLQPEPPASVRVERLESRVETLQTQLDETSNEATRLQEENATLASRDNGQREEIESLTVELYELRSGARWRQWTTGASILGAGMVVGAVLHRNATRRPSTRIRI